MSEKPRPALLNLIPVPVFAAGLGIIGVTVALGVLLSSGSGPGSAEDASVFNTGQVVIEIDDFGYVPSNVSIPRGATVRWSNRDETSHNATADDEEWSTSTIEERASVLLNFDTPGVYTFHCTIHPYMKGTLTVREDAPSTAAAGEGQ